MSKSAVTSLVMGLTLCIPVITSLLGLIFGIAGIRATSGGVRRGRGLAIAGVVLGALGLFFWGGLGAGVLVAVKGSEAPRAVLHSFASNVASGRIAGASAECDPTITHQELEKLNKAMATFGTYRDLTCWSVSVKTDSSGSECEMAGFADFSGGSRRFQSTARKNAAGDWKIVSFEVN